NLSIIFTLIYIMQHYSYFTRFSFTTLFRSETILPYSVTVIILVGIILLRCSPGSSRECGRRRFGKRKPRSSTQRLRNHVRIVRRDRKSTRLNSSHVKTSYAVFCLKKKN